MKCSESVVQFTMAHTIRSSTRIKGLMSIITNFFVKKPVMLAPKNALTNYFRNENIGDNPQKIAGLGRVKLAKIKNLGRKSVKEIAFAVHAIGYIEDMDSW